MIPTINYVAGITFSNTSTKVMLIRKSRPEWMKGKLNGIGGHIEPNESPLEAMRREFTEETKLVSPYWTPFAVLTGIGLTSKVSTAPNKPQQPWLVHWFTAIIPNHTDYMPEGTTDEPVSWFNLEDIHHYPIMPNLLWLIHMALERISNANVVHRYQINEEY